MVNLKTIDNLIAKNITGYIDISYLSIPSTSYFCSMRNKAVISPYKKIVPCVEIIKPGTKDDFILNDNLNKLNFHNIKNIQKNKLYSYNSKNYKSCENCNLVYFCKSNCPMRTILYGDDKPNEYNCKMSKLLIPKFLERISENEKYMNIIFGNDYQEDDVCD